MLQETAIRGRQAKSIQVEAPSFVCSSLHKDLILEQCHEVGIEPFKVILEPLAKNTAAVAAIIGLAMEDCDDDALVLLLPADHYIEHVAEFWSYIQSGSVAAIQGDIVTFGIQPTHPETGYGYIQAGAVKPNKALEIIEFVEKPSLETAKSYLADGRYYWNAGIFLFRPNTIIDAFQSHAADILGSAKCAFNEAKFSNTLIFLDAVEFDKCRSESFDYAIMEKAQNISLIGPVKVGWSDIGSWRAVWDHQAEMQASKTDLEKKTQADHCLVNSHNVLIRSSGAFVATVGVSNLGVIVTQDSVLVVDLCSAQDVKKVVESLKASGKRNLL